MSADDVVERWPVLDTTPFPEYSDDGELINKDYGEFSAVHEHGCGHMDSNLCLSDMKKVLDREGVPVHFSSPVASFDVSNDGSKVQGVVLGDASSTRVSATTVVNCAGCVKLAVRPITPYQRLPPLLLPLYLRSLTPS